MPSPYNIDVHYSCIDCGERKAHPFCNLSKMTMEALEKIKFTSVYPRGALLFVEEEQPRGVFILCSGRVKLTTSSSEGKKLILKIVEPGEVLGLSSAILGKEYEVTAETIEPCQVNFIKRTEFLQFLNEHTEACFHTAEQLSAKYQMAQREIRSLGLSASTGEKLAKLLLDWCETGTQVNGSVRLKVVLTHEEIAQMLGTTRETITRLLSDLRKKKIIDIKGSTVMVTDRGQLEDMVTI
jgi:CRP/FNR family transcriptional regulator